MDFPSFHQLPEHNNFAPPVLTTVKREPKLYRLPTPIRTAKQQRRIETKATYSSSLFIFSHTRIISSHSMYLVPPGLYRLPTPHPHRLATATDRRLKPATKGGCKRGDTVAGSSMVVDLGIWGWIRRDEKMERKSEETWF